MRIDSLFENSLIDWEGKLSAVIFTKGCNFRCGYCHNPSLVLTELINSTEDIPEDRVLTFLRKRKTWLDGVVITGGEPTIHKDLPEFIHKIKQLGLLIKLDTNGTNPLMIKNLIDDKLIDYISMDIKTIIEYSEYQRVTNSNNPDYIDRIFESVIIIRISNIQYQFRTTILPNLHSEYILTSLDSTFKNDPYIKQYFRNGMIIDNIILTESV